MSIKKFLPLLFHRYIYIALIISLCFREEVVAQSNYVDSLNNWLLQHPAVDSQYILTLHRLSYRLSENDINQSFKYFERVSSLSDSINFTYGKSLAQINLGILLYNSANFAASNSAYYKAIDYAEACNALRLKAVSLNNTGDNFRALNEFNKCRQYAKEAIDINKKLKAWRGVAINYELLQQCDLKEKLYKNAKNNLVSGMPYALKSNESYVLSQYYLGFGKLHAINNEPDSASFYFKEAMKQARLQGDLRNKYQVYIAEAEYLKNISVGGKIVLLDSAYSIAKNTGYMEGIAQAADLLTLVYDKKRDKDSSLFYYRLYRTANDSLFSENNRRNVIIKESDWRIKRKEIENRHLEEISQLQKRDLIFKNALLLTLMLLLILIVAVSFFIYKSIKSKKRREDSLFKQKIAEIQMQSLRAQMNPHFIFNSLNSIENFMMRNEKRAAIEYLNKFSGLMRMILDSSRTELVPFSKDMEAIQLYVELEQLRFNNKFSFKTNIDPELANGDFQVPSLLIQPYVENAIIHGLSQSELPSLELKLSATLENGYIIYLIEDNGIGREQSRKYKKYNKPFHKSVGLQLTQERILIFNLQQNSEGDVSITDLFDNNNEPAGTRVRVKIKAV